MGERCTLELGRRLGRLLKGGDVVALWGELGSGKTRLTQGIAEGLGVPPDDPIRSPSFALIHEHQGRVRLYHMDFYRLEPDRWEPDLGLEDYLWGEGVCVIEWPDRIVSLLPPDHLDVHLVIRGPRKREMTLRSYGPRSYEILEGIETDEETWRPTLGEGKGDKGNLEIIEE
jgi:tRNA threonylcarbamoyladenosine biosynthesis protein TsaE